MKQSMKKIIEDKSLREIPMRPCYFCDKLSNIPTTLPDSRYIMWNDGYIICDDCRNEIIHKEHMS